MLFRSILYQRRQARAMILLAAIAAGLVSGTSQQAHAGKTQPSPFTGCYVFGVPNLTGIPITIDASGRINDATDGRWVDISGSISDSGSIKLVVAQRSLSLGHPGGGGVRRDRYIGTAALDASGNLYGVLQDEYGGLWTFYWPRCA